MNFRTILSICSLCLLAPLSLAQNPPALVSEKASPAQIETLFRACEKGHASIVRSMLEQGVPVNMSNARQYTPVWIAIKNGHAEIVQMLVQHGARLDMHPHHPDFPKNKDKELTEIIALESALLPMRHILTNGIIGNRSTYHDVYTAEDLQDYKLCYPEDYTRYLAEIAQGKAEVTQVINACREWMKATKHFTETYYSKELSSIKSPGFYDRSNEVQAALSWASRKDANSFAEHACWYTTPIGVMAPDKESATLYTLEAPANAPAEVKDMLNLLHTHSVGKHDSSTLITDALNKWTELQKQEIAEMRQTLLHDEEVIRLFDESVAAWERYLNLMMPLHISRCHCTDGSENRKLGIMMRSHRARVLAAIRDMARLQLPYPGN
ncbi:MAG: ankyrin repeat domain-containing protein [Akkermansia sp.]|nr:ankyrin repeat domain-containing protein [Akkermansia sp.]